MQKWEYNWRRIYYKGGFLGGGHYELSMNDRTLKDQQIWDHLDELGRNGWELVSTIPEIVGHGGAGSSTDGYMLWFKRPIE